ncbi:hypothetical protein MC885_010054, partial [Smutsia gigantea]
MSVLLSVFLSRPQKLPAIEHSTRKQTSQKSIQDLLAFETGLGVSGGDARVSFDNFALTPAAEHFYSTFHAAKCRTSSPDPPFPSPPSFLFSSSFFLFFFPGSSILSP